MVQQSPGHAIITGATQGIGLEAARELARLGYRLTLVARDPDSLGRVAAGINAVAGAGVVTTRVADLSLLRQVKRLGEEILAAGEPIQALVHNAGAYFNPRRVTGEGVETTWALNHLAVFGLIPPWSRDGKNFRQCYNARVETVGEKPSFRQSWKQRHWCVIPADAFFEPSYETSRVPLYRDCALNNFHCDLSFLVLQILHSNLHLRLRL